MASAPVLFMIFKRPELTFKVFSEIRAYQPSKLYISIDGPRNAAEAIMVDKVRDIIRIDWKCEVYWNINQQNMGCKIAVSSAISWFFNHEEMGIILEDDTLPTPTFFTFCHAMLEKYKHDTTVGHISGSNLINNPTPSSYYFSKYCHGWGWASWSRVWKNYDVEIRDFESLPYHKISLDLFERIYWHEKFRDCSLGIIDTWDYQLLYMLWKYDFKSIIPKNNMVSNIGFNNSATHYAFKNLALSNLKTIPTTFIDHPESTQIDIIADKLIYKKIYKRMLPSNILHLMMAIYKFNKGQFTLMKSQASVQTAEGV